MAESMRYVTFIISARDSSHEYTQQGVNRDVIAEQSKLVSVDLPAHWQGRGAVTVT